MYVVWCRVHIGVPNIFDRVFEIIFFVSKFFQFRQSYEIIGEHPYKIIVIDVHGI